MNQLISFPQIFLLHLLSLLPQCSEKHSADETNVFDYTHFTFTVQSGTKPETDLVNQHLEKTYTRILDNHGLSSIGKVNFYLFENVASLREQMNKKYPNIYVPDFAIGLTPSATEMYIVKQPVSRYEIYTHEFTHCVSQHLNPTIPNRPRWLWESIAQYEAGQLVEPKNIPSLVAGSLPTLASLNDFNNPLIYQVGYLFGEFIFNNHGKDKYIQLIRKNGNIQTVFGITDNAFVDAWYRYLKQKYVF